MYCTCTYKNYFISNFGMSVRSPIALHACNAWTDFKPDFKPDLSCIIIIAIIFLKILDFVYVYLYVHSYINVNT